MPRVAHELTSTKVLVMEFCEGRSLKDPKALRAAGIDCEELVLRVCDAWACMMFRDGVFNADCHAGNILVQGPSALGAVPVLLDFGLTYVDRITTRAPFTTPPLLSCSSLNRHEEEG